MTTPTPTPTLDLLSVPAPEPGPADWNDAGVVHEPGLLDGTLIADYQEAWMRANGYRGLVPAVPEGGDGTWEMKGDPGDLWVIDADQPGGWPDACPYMRHEELLALCMDGPLAQLLADTVGEPMGLHLNLTGWTSTTRNWHQDGYLNPDHVGDAYAAVWIALDKVHLDSGVFQFVPGSHRWHRITNSRIAASGIVDMTDPAWPTHTEAVLTDLVEAEIAERDATVVDYAPDQGDVLLWHPRLYHRGTAPRIPNTYRPGVIAHFSGINTRRDFADNGHEPVQHPSGGWYWPIITDQPVR